MSCFLETSVGEINYICTFCVTLKAPKTVLMCSYVFDAICQYVGLYQKHRIPDDNLYDRFSHLQFLVESRVWTNSKHLGWN